MPKVISSDAENRKYWKRPVKDVSLYVSEKAMISMTEHADQGFETNKEVMGLMMGDVYIDDWGEYVLVRDVATSVLDASAISVRFNREHLEQLFESIDMCEGEYVVGWYHSHLGIGCYLSDVDIKTHEGIFGMDTGFAIVIDPAELTIVPFRCSRGIPEKVNMIIME